VLVRAAASSRAQLVSISALVLVEACLLPQEPALALQQLVPSAPLGQQPSSLLDLLLELLDPVPALLRLSLLLIKHMSTTPSPASLPLDLLCRQPQSVHWAEASIEQDQQAPPRHRRHLKGHHMDTARYTGGNQSLRHPVTPQVCRTWPV